MGTYTVRVIDVTGTKNTVETDECPLKNGVKDVRFALTKSPATVAYLFIFLFTVFGHALQVQNMLSINISLD